MCCRMRQKQPRPKTKQKEKQPDETDYDTLMRAAMLGGMAIAHTGTSLPHALSYALTYHLHVAHGKAVCYFLAGYLKEADQSEVSRILELSGFSSVEEFHAAYRLCCHDPEIEEDQLLAVIEQSCKDVSSNPAKCAKAPYPCDEDTIRRIASYAKNQEES